MPAPTGLFYVHTAQRAPKGRFPMIMLYADGGFLESRRDPKPRRDNPRGVIWSVGVEVDGDCLILERGTSMQHDTNNEAEWLALTAALRHLHQWATGATDAPLTEVIGPRSAIGRTFPNRPEPVTARIRSDSEHVVRCFTGRYKLRAAHLIPMRRETWRLRERLAEAHVHVGIEWVSRKEIVPRLGH